MFLWAQLPCPNPPSADWDTVTGLWGVAGGNNGTRLHLWASAVGTGGPGHSPSVLWEAPFVPRALATRAAAKTRVWLKPCCFIMERLRLLGPAGSAPSLLSLVFPSCCWNPGGSWDGLCWAGAHLSWLVSHKGRFHVSVRHGIDSGWPDGKGTTLF